MFKFHLCNSPFGEMPPRELQLALKKKKNYCYLNACGNLIKSSNSSREIILYSRSIRNVPWSWGTHWVVSVHRDEVSKEECSMVKADGSEFVLHSLSSMCGNLEDKFLCCLIGANILHLSSVSTDGSMRTLQEALLVLVHIMVSFDTTWQGSQRTADIALHNSSFKHEIPSHNLQTPSQCW